MVNGRLGILAQQHKTRKVKGRMGFSPSKKRLKYKLKRRKL